MFSVKQAAQEDVVTIMTSNYAHHNFKHAASVQ